MPERYCIRYRFLDAGTSVPTLMLHLKTRWCVFIHIFHFLRNRCLDA